MLKLYYLQGACPLVPHVALHWANADFQAIRLERGEQKSPLPMCIATLCEYHTNASC
ncbi:hypothetical protein [Lonepinella koalarum]|uniref:Glutathione S-transferase-like protein n=2 Tax=Lonepinella koalarum TaxID=53417 RepID=A0A4R1L073_9PAST|nr:hypothetical protein [Lonepinella koalarum]TCK71184.1 hypothetical protein EV692_0248 [Lonepinella koalarum]